MNTLTLTAEEVGYLRKELVALYTEIGEGLIDDQFGDEEGQREAAKRLHAKLGRALGVA